MELHHENTQVGSAQARAGIAEPVPDAVAPPPRHPRFPLIDGTRAIAVLGVVIVHSAVYGGATGAGLGGRLLAHLNLGVAIFFVISGFLLYRPFIAHRAGGAASPGVGQYGKRRALRIFPAYWLALVVLTVLPGLTGVYGGHWLAQAGLVQTLPPSPTPNCTQAPSSCDLAQTWSLVIEATFYLVLPFYALASARLCRLGGGRRWAARELVILAVLAVASTALVNSGAHGWLLDWVRSSALGYWLWFGLGMSAAIASVVLPTSRTASRVAVLVRRRPWLFWCGAAGIYLAISLALPPTPFLFSRSDQVIVQVAFGVMALLIVLPAIFGSDEDRGPARVLGARPVAWLGLVSYGVFLWHYAFAVNLGNDGAGWAFVPVLAVTLAGSVACAAFSYYALERRVLRLKYRAMLPRRAAVSATGTRAGRLGP
jgi:peptidoglycan/LPS O-acetylase OafA/YrhL